MKSKRILALLLAMMLILSACGGGGGDKKSDAKLVYWTMWNEAEPQGKVIGEAVKAFTEKTGVEVEINYNGRDIRKTLGPALSGGEVIDIFDEDIERVLNVWGEYLLDLTEYAGKTYDDTDGKPYKSLVNQTLINLAEELGGGKIKNIPYQPSTFVTMYNKGLFDAAGVTALPTNWDEFLDVCEKLKESGVTPLTVDDAYMAALFGYTMSRVAGAEACYDAVNNLDFSGPEVLRTCEIFAELVDKGYLSSKAATNVYPEGQVSEFANETVAMYLNGTWLPNEIKGNNPDIKWGSFAWPAIDAAGDGAYANNFGAQSFGINKDTKYPEEAFALVRWLTLGEYDQKLADESMGVPMANDATWPEQLAEAKAVIDSTTKRLNWAVGMEDVADVNAAIKDGLSKLITGAYTAEDFADQLAALK
ncbi:extracellular solute-binding protein [Clostridiaceae bacterium OttesenSCG-928-D20]|nr:extracellular solute-binding protein [Clostridiaceae bacterium OttesenSCG-928-D20]